MGLTGAGLNVNGVRQLLDSISLSEVVSGIFLALSLYLARKAAGHLISIKEELNMPPLGLVSS